MEMPKPTPAHKQLEAFAGNWSGEERMHPSPWDPKGGMAKGTMTNRVAHDGFYVIGDYVQERDGAVAFQGHGVFSLDPQTQELVLHWFDCMGMGANVFRGKIENSSVVMLCQNVMGNHRLTYDWREKGTLRTKMESSQEIAAGLIAKPWTTMFDGVYHRSS